MFNILIPLRRMAIPSGTETLLIGLQDHLKVNQKTINNLTLSMLTFVLLLLSNNRNTDSLH